ncbi:MAG: tetratricopeptide repeat protein [Candidatus Azobacteroides sp.]|nr:tetratricopeptide repeat protein [Candidatus Azobacteroides sp.]
MGKSRFYTISIFLLLLVGLVSCTSVKNTVATRWYHSFNTRYNVFFNGNEAYNEALKAQQDGYKESYSDFILMYPVSSLPKDKATEGGPFDRSVEKAAKAIKTHSIKTKPEKKQGKKKDPKYQEFMAREEYNPFLYKAWLLMGKSQFQNGDFLTAASTFSYVARHYSTQPAVVADARIWQARCYSEMGWYYEADNLLSKLNNQNLPKKESDWFSSVYADYLIKQKKYEEAIPYLKTAIKAEKNKNQRLRMTYLLGQILTDLGQKTLAYETFGKVAGSTAPYPLQFSSKIRQTEVFPGGDTKKVTDMLKQMSKDSKNKDFLDQVYYAWGNVYMSIPDTAKAVETYKLGVEKSTQNGFDKALSLIRLGDIYFQQRKYVEAQPCYSDALGLINKDYKDYPKVSKRSEVLDELVVYVEAVQLQDSLQTLARMPEAERLAVVDKIIKEYIKKEEEAKKAAEKEEYLAQQQENADNMGNFSVGRQTQAMTTPGIRPPTGGDPFYFYNPQMVAQGKTDFQNKWGKRKLEDNWRQRTKITQFDDGLADNNGNQESPDETGLSQDSTVVPKTAEELAAANDPKNREYYLKQIPLTEEDVAASDEIWMDGLFNMGIIYKDNLEDYSLAIDAFNDLNKRFPDNENKLDAYHQLYLMYLRMGNTDMSELYKAKIRAEFPQSDLAVAMADPNYEYNMRMLDSVQDSIYEQTFEYYTVGNSYGIRDNFNLVSQKYPQSKLMPQFMFLNALSYAQTNDPAIFKEKLKELLGKYPDADVSILAGDMMKGLLKGMTLSGDGNLARGGLFNLRFGGEVGENGELLDSTIVFSPEKNTPHLLLMVYPADKVNTNVILYTVAEFNFSNFMVNDFDLQIATVGETGMFQVRGFNNYDEVMQYYEMINRPEGYMHTLDNAVIVVPMSVDNYDILLKGKSLEEYIEFFEKNFGAENQQLIHKWRSIQEEKADSVSEKPDTLEDLVIAKEEDNESTKEENIQPADIPENQRIDSTEIIHPDTIISVPQDTIPKIKGAISEDEVAEKVSEIADKASKTFDTINQTIDEIANDPIRGIKDLFSKRKSSNAIDEYVKQQEKEDKARQKQLNEEQKAKDKVQQELAKQQEKEQKALLKKQQEEDKALLKSKQDQEKALVVEKKNELKAKEDARKQQVKDKETALKQKQADAKAREKQKVEERKAKEKARKEALKLKERQREAERKQKEAERKAKVK